MIFRNIKVNFTKIMSGYGFYICVFFTMILCFATYIFEETISGNRYTVIRSYFSFDREFMLQTTSLSSVEVMRCGTGSWLSLFLPIITAFAFVPVICEEHKSRAVRFEVLRSGKINYYCGRFISGCLYGGLSVMLGYGLYAIVVYRMFPGIGEYSAALQRDYWKTVDLPQAAMFGEGYLCIILPKLAEVCLYGMICAAPILLLTALIHNQYVVICLPFFLKYGLSQICMRINTQPNVGIKAFGRHLATIIDPDALADLSEYGSDAKWVLIYSACIIVGSFVLYLLLQRRRLDSGE